MNRPVIEVVLGTSWRSSLSAIGVAIMGLLTALAAAPYQLGDVATIIPPEWKAKLFLGSAIATFILKIINGRMTKDTVVSGTPATGQIIGPKGEEVRAVEPEKPATP